jgi:integrase
MRTLSMPKVMLTDRFAASAKPLNGDERTDFFDALVTGLCLRATKDRRSWSFCFANPIDRKWTRLTLGTYPAISLAAARGKALEAKGQVDSGNDPRASDQAAANMTVAELVASYLADPEKQALRSRASIERRLRKNVLPVIGEVKLSELRRRDVRNVIDPMMQRNVKVEAALTFANIRAVIRWAVQREYLEHNPLEGMEKPAVVSVRDRVLSDDEIFTLWNSLPVALPSIQCQRVVKLCLITGQRVGEVSGMTRGEIDLSAREWRLPGSRTKNAHPHVVPLSDLAIEIIGEALADSGNAESVFPNGHGSVSAVAVGKAIIRAGKRFGIPRWSAHDLRRTVITEMARLGVAPVVLGHVANHRGTTHAGVTLAVYAKYTYDKEKRAALDLWAERLLAIVGGAAAKITPLPNRQASG